MINISIKQLRYFEALARLGHFGRAAESCSISQPALSIQIKELETTLGAPLVERNSKNVHLTGLGQEVAQRARHILRSVEDLGDLARASGDSLSGRLRIGVIPTIAPYFLPSVIAALSEKYPSLDIHPRETVTENLLQDIIDAKLDVAIVALPVSEPNLHEEFLFEEEFVLVRPQKDAHKPAPNLEKLRHMRLLLLEEGHCFRDQALSFCKIPVTSQRELMEGSSLSTLVQMVGAGIGVTLIPDMAIAIDTQSAPVCVSRFPTTPPTRSVGMVWRKNSALSDQLMLLSKTIRDTLP